MAWFKFGKNDARTQAKAPAQAPVGSVEAMRQQAKFRLIGSIVLVLIAVVGLPILFDSQPRPVPVDIPIEIPDKARVKPLVMPPTASQPAPAARVENSASLSGQEEIVTNSTAATSNTPKPSPKPSAKPSPAQVNTAQAATRTVANPTVDNTQTTTDQAKAKAAKEAALAKAAEKANADKAAAEKAAADKADKADKAAKAKEDAAKLAADKAAKDKQAAADKAAKDKEAAAARAQALLEGQGAAPKPSDALPDTGRFIVQFGAFSDETKSREVRQKVERAGLKTYAQVAKTADGDRIRVRVGPFATKAEAEKAASKIKALSLPASILAL
jgi:DedD protein